MTEREALKRWAEVTQNIQRATSVNINETPADKQQRIERAKRDYKFFVEYYYPHYATSEVPDFHIDLAKRVKANKTCKYLVRWGRGLAKSVVCDITIPMWLWVNGETVYLVIVGNNEDKATILLNDIQAEFSTNQRIIADFGAQVKQGSWAKGGFTCKERFMAKAIGMGQDARGLREGAQRPNLIIPDDLEDKDTLRNPRIQDDVVKWIERSLLPTMDGDTRRYLHPNNNFAPRTIQGLLEERHKSWKVHRVDACPGADRVPRWKNKYHPNYYKELEDEIGTIALESEYNNTPFVEGSVFTADMIQWGKPPRIDHFEFIVGRWDPAYSGKNDYNAVRVWGLKDHKFWLISAFVRQCKMKEAVRWICGYNAQLPPSVYIHWRVESQFWNDPLRESISEVEQELKTTAGISVVDSPKGKKLDRLMRMHPYYQNGRAWWSESIKSTNDCQVGLAQLLGIEPGYRTHDDAPDADEQAISDLVKVDRALSFNPSIGKLTTSHSW